MADEQEWPLARTRYTDFHLHSGGNANTLDGDGWLNTQPAQDESPDVFLYDPIDPAPSSPDGPHDQRKVEGRPDVLIYSTSPLKAKLEVTGPVRAELYAASSAANTDFTAKLVDVYPDGRAIELCQGIIRAAFREGETNPTNIRPGTVYRYDDRPVGHQQCVPARPPHPAGGRQQQLPEVRPQPQHRRPGRLRLGGGDRRAAGVP